MALPYKRRALSLHDKMKIIKYIDKKSKNYKKTQIAEELDIPRSTLTTILKSREIIEEKCKNLRGRVLRTKKKNKSGKFTELENVLVDWIHSMNSQNLPPNGPMITKRALEIANDLEISDFAGSAGWLGRFRKRHDISFRQIEGEDSNGDDESISSLESFHEVIKGYQTSDIFSADEFGLFYRLMPYEDLNVEDMKCENGAFPAERLTILACANLNGTEKLPLLVIGTTIVSSTNFPCQYEVERLSWMNKQIFTNWLKVLDDYFEIQGRLIVLLVDNSPVHPKDIVLNNINLVILSPDSKNDLPMTQGIVKAIKQNYRMKLIEISENNTEVVSDRKTIGIQEALEHICSSWNSVKPGIIQSSFQKAGYGEYYEVDDDDDEYKAEIYMKRHDYICIDFDLATCGINGREYEIDLETNQEVYNKNKEKHAPNVIPNEESATAMASIENLKQYLTSINSQIGLDKLACIETIVVDSCEYGQ